MSSLMSSYHFNAMGRIGNEPLDNTQTNLHNSKIANYHLANYFSEITDADVKFVLNYPTMQLNAQATGGVGIHGSAINTDSLLTIQTIQERPLDKLQNFQRPFATIPFLGRGSCNPDIESQLLQGELVSEKKSVSTIMDKSFMSHTMFPGENDDDIRAKTEDMTLNGWVRGGVPSREQEPVSVSKR